MKVSDARIMARKLMDANGLRDWDLRFDNAKRRLGVCNYTRKFISLSRHFIELNDEAEMLDTVLHEIAHALTPGANHGPEWKAAARMLGAKPERTATLVVAPSSKWLIWCSRCDRALGKRHTKRLKLDRRRCGFCKEKHTLEWKKNDE